MIAYAVTLGNIIIVLRSFHFVTQPRVTVHLKKGSDTVAFQR